LACVGAVLLTALAAGAALVRADEPAASDGVFITVTYPLDDAKVGRLIELSNEARKNYRNRLQAEGIAARPLPLKIVYDFTPDGQASGATSYGSCREFAAYLLSLTDVTTIAFVHGDLTRHAVLPALACQELVMADGARIGDARRDQVEPVGKDQLVFYREVAEKRGRSPALVVKMLDTDLEVFAATRNGGVLFVDGSQPPPPGAIVDRTTGPLFPRGGVALFTTAEAVKYELCRLNKQTRVEVARWYGLPESALRDQPLLGGPREAWCIEVRGAFTPVLEETLKRRLSRVVGQKSNFIILRLECGGGDPTVADNLARFVRELKDNSGTQPVMTIAYVTEHARDTAVFLALGCTHIVMKQDARLGDFEAYLKSRPQFQAPIARMLKDLAEQRYYPPLLFQGMVEPDLVLYRARNQKNPLEWSILTEERLRAEANRWAPDQGGPLKPAGELLTLDAGTAGRLGIAAHVVDDLNQVYAAYRVDAQSVRQAGPDWLDRIASFLRTPAISFVVIGVGLACLILELKLPGIGLPGVVAALCFVLFFWAHAELTFLWLAVLLFVLGLVGIALEIFVFPGFGVLGVSGIIMLIGGLVLATLERWPQTESEWTATLTNLGGFGAALIGAFVSALFVARYLPNIPYANRMVLVPAMERPGGEDEPSPALARAAALLGVIGVAATPLRPAGMVRFGEEYVDVVAESGYVEPGARVQVVEVEAHRIVVKEV